MLSVYEALSWIKQLHLFKVIVELDSQMVFTALRSTVAASSPFAMLITACQILASSLVNVIFAFVKRSANLVAHSVGCSFYC